MASGAAASTSQRRPATAISTRRKARARLRRYRKRDRAPRRRSRCQIILRLERPTAAVIELDVPKSRHVLDGFDEQDLRRVLKAEGAAKGMDPLELREQNAENVQEDVAVHANEVESTPPVVAERNVLEERQLREL